MAPRRRIYAGFSKPIDPYQGGKAGNHDPRSFISGNVPGQQWDIQQFARDRLALEYDAPPQIGDTPVNGGAQAYPARTVPTRIQFTRWTLNGTTPASGQNPLRPCLLVPKNPLRVAIEIGSQYYALVAADIQILHYCWGDPQISATPPVGSYFGHVLAPGQVLRYDAGCCPIDDLWVWNLNASNVNYVAFEGIAVPEANQL